MAASRSLGRGIPLPHARSAWRGGSASTASRGGGQRCARSLRHVCPPPPPHRFAPPRAGRGAGASTARCSTSPSLPTNWNARGSVFRSTVSRPVVQSHPAHHSQRRSARERKNALNPKRGLGVRRCGSYSTAENRNHHPRARLQTPPMADKDRAFLKSITLYGGCRRDGVRRWALLYRAVRALRGTLMACSAPCVSPDGQRPRLVHRLDKDTAGCLLVAKTRFAAAALAKTFRSRSARKIYWALVAGVPKPRQGRISTFLAKEEREKHLVHAHRKRMGRRAPAMRDHHVVV